MSNNTQTLNLGPLDVLLRDPDVTEILIDGPHSIYVERDGKLIDAEETFRDETHLMEIIDIILAAQGRKADESNPIVDVFYPDDSRIHVVVPPIAINGPFMVIRKFPRNMMTPEDLIKIGAWTDEIVEFLRACVASRLNIAITGGNGSGKTTIFNCIASMIDDEERILVVQDSADLRVRKKRVVRQESRPANLQGKGAVTLQDLMQSAIKMRPDRILLSEAHGPEMNDLLAAMNMGFDGCMFSLHANNTRDALSRIESMATMGNLSMPLVTIREQIASSVNIVLNQARLPDGTRKVLKLAEVVGMVGDTIALQDIFEFRQLGRDPDGTINGQFTATGYIPRVLTQIRNAGIELPMSVFTPR